MKSEPWETPKLEEKTVRVSSSKRSEKRPGRQEKKVKKKKGFHKNQKDEIV